MNTMWEEKLDVLETTEVHWSTSTILAVFFAASLISAVFFGLGYSFGLGGITKSARVAALAETMSHSVPSADSTQPANVTLSNVPAVSDAHREKASEPSARAALQRVSETSTPQPLALVKSSPSKPVVTHKDAADASATVSATLYMVQVGAIGDHKDAQTLVSQLRKHGFHAGIYPGKHDKFLHVQIGPFAGMQQAQTMRHKVIASGYRAMLKHAS